MMTSRPLRNLIAVAMTTLFIANGAGWPLLPLLERLENIVYDYRMRLTMPGGVDPRIVIVDIDDRSLQQEGHWPWGRDKLARIVDILFDHYYVGLLGFDVVFAEYDERSGLAVLERLAEGELSEFPAFRERLEALRPELDLDHRFAESLQGRDVILGFSSSKQNRYGALPPPVLKIEDELARIPFHQVAGYNGNLPELQRAAWGGGYFDNSSVDADGVFRRMPLVQRIDDGLYESLPLAMVRAIYGQPPLTLDIASTLADGQEWGLEALRVGPLRVPVDQHGVALVPYRGASGSFRYVSATDVLARKVPPETLDGVIALVGATAPGLLDFRSTPVQNRFAGVEVQANLVAGMLDQRIKKKPAYTMAADILALLLIGLFGMLLLPRLSPISAIVVTFGIGALLLSGNLYAWSGADLALPLAGQLLLLLTFFIFSSAWGFFIETRGKRRLSALFGQYVPKEVVDDMNGRGGDFGVAGESREMSVLFSDIRSFTSISEGMEPDDLKRLINAYLTPMTAIVHRYRGTVDKYIGDAVMAFWGAPLPDSDHARQAVLAALAMQQEMEAVRADFRARGWPELDIGIGVNSGRMNVGNMGSEFRMSYTVLGDAVNLGSRLEGLTKQYGAGIVVSEFTRVQAPGLAYRELDRVRVKGKELPVAIYEPVGAEKDLTARTREELEHHQTALEAYRTQDWGEASRLFGELNERGDGRKLYQLYLERIDHLRENPPGDDWDAVFTYTTK